MSTSWWSQPFPPDGGAAADGIMKQLGRPKLDPLTVLVREAAQNSWDARMPGASVDFRIGIRRLGDGVDAWRAALDHGRPPESGLLAGIDWSAETLVMTISDRGTRGLGGPLRAGVEAPEGVHPDFVQFLRNVGEPRDQHLGGGSFGFGKGIYYGLSGVGSILVDSRSVEESSGRRLMGASLTSAWSREGQRYTGRHWWGVVADDGIPDPLQGEDAERQAAALGLPGFSPDDFGTDITILAPRFGSANDDELRTPEDALRYIRSSIVWHLWPKTVSSESAPVMNFFTEFENDLELVPPAESVEQLRPFVAALQAARAGERSYSPKKRLVASLGIELTPERRLIDDEFSVARPFDAPLRHIARMRRAELVVDYQELPEHFDPAVGYSGVFLASEEADASFVAAEPPTHDDWRVANLDPEDRRVVAGAMRFMRAQVAAMMQPPQADGAGSHDAGLGRLSTRLAAFAVGLTGSGSHQLLADVSAVSGSPSRPSGRVGSASDNGTSDGAGGAHSRRRQGDSPDARVKVVDGPALFVDERGVTVVRSLVEVPDVPREIRVTAKVVVVLDSGKPEAEPPTAAEVPRVLGWHDAETGEQREGAELSLDGRSPGRWWVSASGVADSVVRLTVEEVG
ncbi:hypothetical protein [Amnibacterium setariae]|uniref:Uncharacterized protein n=1 Tax=Amnibacterium setariae TaxID=2306585 RepID=A0A3A1U1Z4_9MICO|nr:hypothetical protein [Amnibacterium setariae]RIX27847.1 hypothetical protein D1781_09950 [Amnibacterium setariae]